MKTQRENLNVRGFWSTVLAIAIAGTASSPAALAMGKKPGQIEIPATATVLFQSSTEHKTGDDNWESHESDSALASDLLQVWQNDAPDDLEFKCQTVYRKWDKPIHQNGQCSGEKWWGGQSDCIKQDTLTVTTYCQARDLQQQQILSLKKTCETQPTQECFSKDFLDYLGKLQPTQYLDIDEPSGGSN